MTQHHPRRWASLARLSAGLLGWFVVSCACWFGAVLTSAVLMVLKPAVEGSSVRSGLLLAAVLLVNLWWAAPSLRMPLAFLGRLPSRGHRRALIGVALLAAVAGLALVLVLGSALFVDLRRPYDWDAEFGFDGLVLMVGIPAAFVVIWVAALSMSIVASQLSRRRRPFGLFLRAFGRWADSGVVRALIPGIPRRLQLVYVLPPLRATGISNFDPVVLCFLGWRPWRPFGKVPAVVRLSDDSWQSEVSALIRAAAFIVIDCSEATEAVEYELEEIGRWNRVDRTLCLGLDSPGDESQRRNSATVLPGARRFSYQVAQFAGASRILALCALVVAGIGMVILMFSLFGGSSQLEPLFAEVAESLGGSPPAENRLADQLLSWGKTALGIALIVGALVSTLVVGVRRGMTRSSRKELRGLVAGLAAH